MQIIKYLSVLFTVSCMSLCAAGKAQIAVSPLQEMRNIMKNIHKDNEDFMEAHKNDPLFFAKQECGQAPRATIVCCSDSRVHTTNFDLRPLGDIFLVRNIGNQLETCLGSIDYGVLHKHTPLLLFLGHSKCGAVEAVSKQEHFEMSICAELSPMKVTHQSPDVSDEQIKENIIENVHQQVNKAKERYSQLIQNHHLWVVGAVYDFTTKGKGELKIIQVNDRTDTDFIQAFLEDAEVNGVNEEPL
jgi:carbonic anhydrase